MGCTMSHFKTSEKDHKLVICGAYQYTRHPMYLNFIMHPLVVLLISQNWFLTLAYTPWVACALLRIRREERMLVNIFGQAYLDYMLRVPALGPLQWLNKHCGLSHIEAQKVLLTRHVKDEDTAAIKKDE
jgi:protein-S-isoprenylcysteine O-methyltransferase Ste14